MIKPATAALILAMGLAAPACAQMIALGTKDISAAAAGEYTLDKSHANVVFSINHIGFSNYIGRFNSLDGKLLFDPANIEKSSVSITIDPASVDTNNAKLEGELKGEKYFNTVKFPAITFVSTSVTKTGDSTGTVTGDLTFMGVTKPVTLTVSLGGAGKHPFTGKPVIGFAAKGSIKRSEFGLTELIPAVSDEVQLLIETEFNQ